MYDDSDEQLGTADIDPNDIIIQSEIATGSFGKVFKGELYNSPCAIKQMFQIAGKFDIEAFRREVQIMSKLSHPNVVLLMGASVRPENIFIITEYIEGTDLNKVLEEESEISMFRIYNLALGIATGMNWLHNLDPPIVHRDLKPANVLIAITETSWLAKICDFGLSTVRDVAKLTTKNLVGSVAWMPPEALLRQPFDEKVDIYAYSLILWQLFTCEKYPMDTSPFRSIQDLTRAVCDDYLRPDIPDHVPHKINKLMRAGWSDNPIERPTFTKIISTLKKALVPAITNNLEAGKFWSSHWSEVGVSFKSFFEKMYYHFERDVPASTVEDGDEYTFFKCVETVFKEQGNNVTLESFGHVLNWFGEFDDQLPRRVYNMLYQPWFHGPSNREEAEYALLTTDKKRGFLVRTNPNPNTPFTISILKSRSQHAIIHQRVFRTENGFSFTVKDTKTKKSSLIEETTLVGLVTEVMRHDKLKIIMRPKYEKLFSKEQQIAAAGAYAY
eukprot:TRINITY_DN6590_c0_g1_i1.p1 TRINITY_DN6590_c0_g1~~TRINITY_DN6590_c0_g1_i1.p1  ORF type:complete len:499 (-),score=94.40 TRINITY_DN6590_c0_g1_i1:189-1685(-)